jgi:transmembrane sensor
MESRSARDCIEAAAAAWDVRLRSHACTDADRNVFMQWCEASPEHQDAFDRLQIALRSLRAHAEHPQLRAIRERAEVMTGRFRIRRVIVRSSIAAAVVLAALAMGVFQSGRHRLPLATQASVTPALQAELDAKQSVYSTGPRERRTVALPDGSNVTLNALTQVQTEWLPHERRIQLVSGQALFRVAKDASRPFIVTAGDRTVTALGTEFDVNFRADKVQVTLLEGRIAVRGVGHAAPQPALELKPNQQLVAIAGQSATVRTVDAARSIGWVNGQVFFTDEALPAAVAQMNDYSSQEIVVGDPSLARYRVNGMFLSGNQDGFVSALTSYYPIEARRDADGRIVLLPRSGRAADH